MGVANMSIDEDIRRYCRQRGFPAERERILRDIVDSWTSPKPAPVIPEWAVAFFVGPVYDMNQIT